LRRKLPVKLIIICLALCVGLPNTAYAIQMPGYDGGIKNDMEYKELFVLTGKPVILKGDIKINEGAMRKGKRQDRVNFTLESDDKNISLRRNMTFEVSLEEDTKKRQYITVSELTRFSESITVKGEGRRSDRYKLEKCELYSSTVTDMAPAVDYYSLNIRGKKLYSVNRDEGELSVEINGSGVGYEHAWGATETVTLDYLIDYKGEKTIEESVYSADWNGSMQVVESFNTTRDITYIPNEPSQISFRGGYLETIQGEQVARYSYSLPRFDKKGIPLKGEFSKDDVELKLSTVPTQKRTFIPKTLDVPGHWAQEDIERLLSLGIMEPKGSYFGPHVYAKRLTFAQGVAKVTDIINRGKAIADVKKNVAQKKGEALPQEETPFSDISDKDMVYLENLASTGVMQGIGPKRFGPDQVLTRDQAITIMIRALGLEHLAPNPPYDTGFADDCEIPAWARDSVYVARQIGLARGDMAGYFRPSDPMTKGEAAAFLNRFITYLQKDLKKDFKDRIINY
jgi:hypothetical protein